VSILCAEFDIEIAKRVHVEEYAEDVAKKMLSDGISLEQIGTWTGISIETLKNL